MAECPVCNTRLFTENAGFPFINFRRIFRCGACGWRMNVKEVHEKGGLNKIALEMMRGKPKEKEIDPKNLPNRKGKNNFSKKGRRRPKGRCISM